MALLNETLDDTLINAADEVRIRQDLVLTALGRRPADRALRVGRLLDVHSRSFGARSKRLYSRAVGSRGSGRRGAIRARSANACIARILRPFRVSARCISISKARI
jgi:hypothetical protein